LLVIRVPSDVGKDGEARFLGEGGKAQAEEESEAGRE
jgi:hypothetical protein